MKTLFTGQNAIHLHTVDSTNSYAIDLLKQIKPVEGTIIYTFNQKNGRGQRGNTWQSEPNKNVALSLILYPQFIKPESQFLISKITALAIADLMSALLKENDKTHEIRIKWPNDVYIDDKKIAGILIENNINNNALNSSVIGIGINVNQENFEKNIPNAISLKLLLNKEFDIVQLIHQLCEFIEARYLQLRAGKMDKINEEYVNQLFLFNQWHAFKCNGNLLNGKIIGVSAIGKLKIEIESGEVKEFDLKEINT